MKPLISRKEIAQLTGLCVKTIKTREKILGLKAARVDIGTERVFYCRDKVLSALRLRNFLT